MGSLATNWSAILEPGNDAHFFRIEQPPAFEFSTGRFSPATAWWLSEFSRLSYAPFDVREQALLNLGVEERFFCRLQAAQATLLTPGAGSKIGHGFGILSFKGTSGLKDWFTNLDTVPRTWEAGGHVHGGFARALDELWGELGPRLAGFPFPILVTGHSLGAALATLTVSRHEGEVAALYTYGSPRVGNAAFAKSLGDVPCFRVVNGVDIVTQLPLAVEKIDRFNFTHVGEAIAVGTQSSENVRSTPSLKELASSLRAARPPQNLVDHAPLNYSVLLASAACDRTA